MISPFLKQTQKNVPPGRRDARIPKLAGRRKLSHPADAQISQPSPVSHSGHHCTLNDKAVIQHRARLLSLNGVFCNGDKYSTTETGCQHLSTKRKNYFPTCKKQGRATARPCLRSSLNHIILRNRVLKSSTEAALGLPGAQASAAADSARNWRSSSFMASSLVGMPTSTDSWRTASMAALR